MCDYSLHNVRNRLAVEGEPLQVHRFPTSSLGLVSQTDLRPSCAAPQAKRRNAWWQTIKGWFSTTPAVPAVCVPPGARLVVREIPQALQERYHITAEEEVTFVQLSPETIGYRDAVRFRNGREILIQRLPVGLQLDVLTLSTFEEELPPVSAEAVMASYL